MALIDCMTEEAEEMALRAAKICREAKNAVTHEGRIELVRQLLTEYLRRPFGVQVGCIVSSDELFANEPDLLIVDGVNSSPLRRDSLTNYWAAGKVYALVDVRMSLRRNDLNKAIYKCRNFQRFKSRSAESSELPHAHEPLFVVLGFDAPAESTVEYNLRALVRDKSAAERPDFVLVPDRFVVASGRYRETGIIDDRDGRLQRILASTEGAEAWRGPGMPTEMVKFDDDPLYIWDTLLDSWLQTTRGDSGELKNSALKRYGWWEILT